MNVSAQPTYSKGVVSYAERGYTISTVYLPRLTHMRLQLVRTHLLNQEPTTSSTIPTARTKPVITTHPTPSTLSPFRRTIRSEMAPSSSQAINLQSQPPVPFIPDQDTANPGRSRTPHIAPRPQSLECPTMQAPPLPVTRRRLPRHPERDFQIRRRATRLRATLENLQGRIRERLGQAPHSML